MEDQDIKISDYFEFKTYLDSSVSFFLPKNSRIIDLIHYHTGDGNSTCIKIVYLDKDMRKNDIWVIGNINEVKDVLGLTNIKFDTRRITKTHHTPIYEEEE